MRCFSAVGLLLVSVLVSDRAVLALPSPVEPADVPEEVLRSEIILDARSPIDGKPMTATAYAELQAQLQTPPTDLPDLTPQVRKTLNMLRLRKFLKTLLPFY